MHPDLKKALPVLPAVLIVLACATCVLAQSAADPWAQVKKDAQTSESNQRTPAVQARIQGWFVAKIQAYQSTLDDTALGKASPRVVDLGDFGSHLRSVLAPPTGTGTAVVLFSDSVDTASTIEGSMDIMFPKRSADTYIDAHYNTCWHEFQHCISMVSESGGRRPALNIDDWRTWRKLPIDDIPEHVYMESLAEYTVEWLDYLLHDTSRLSGGGPGLAFEKHCRDAYEQMKQYQARNESVSYAVENFCWAKAHEAWIRGWKLAQLIAPMPHNLREDYKQIHGVWIGFVEDIIKFYMEGGLTAKDGKKIRVPEWVMWPEPMKSGIIVGHLNEKTDIQGNSLRCGFDVRVLETYRRKERSDLLNHGAVTITLANPDPDSRLEFSVDGKAIRRSDNSGKIDLSGLKADSRIRVTLARGNLSKLAGKKRYKIVVDYKDDARIAGGAKQPSFYYDSRAIYYVDVTGTAGATAATNASATKSGGKASQPANKPQVAPKPAGQWVLKGTTSSKRVDDMWKTQKNYSFDAKVDATGVEFESIYTDNSNPKKNSAERTRHSWNHPGQTLTPGSKAEVTVTVTDNGSVNIDSAKHGLSAHSRLSAYTQAKGSSYGFGVFTHPASGGTDSNGGGVSIASGSPKQTQSFTCKIPVRDGKPGDTLKITLDSMQIGIMSEVEFTYIYGGSVPEEAPVEEKADAVLVPEEPEPEEDPEQMDNEPPPPGKVVKIKTVKETDSKPTKPQVTQRWYTHARGDYKMKLPDGWTVSEKHFFDEKDDGYDTIWSADQDMAFICARDFTDGFSEAAFKKAVTSIADDVPGAKPEYTTLGAAKAALVGDFNKEEGAMGWQVVLHHKARGYFISVNMQAKSRPARMPDPPAWMLESLVMLR